MKEYIFKATVLLMLAMNIYGEWCILSYIDSAKEDFEYQAHCIVTEMYRYSGA